MDTPVAGTGLAGETRHQIVIAPTASHQSQATTASPSSFLTGKVELRLEHRAGVVIQPTNHAGVEQHPVGPIAAGLEQPDDLFQLVRVRPRRQRRCCRPKCAIWRK